MQQLICSINHNRTLCSPDLVQFSLDVVAFRIEELLAFIPLKHAPASAGAYIYCLYLLGLIFCRA